MSDVFLLVGVVTRGVARTQWQWA